MNGNRILTDFLALIDLHLIPEFLIGWLFYRILCCLIPKRKGKISAAVIFLCCSFIANIVVFAQDLFNITTVLLIFTAMVLFLFTGKLPARLAAVTILYPLVISQNFLIMELLGRFYFSTGKNPIVNIIVSWTDSLLHTLFWFLLFHLVRKKLSQVSLLFDDKTWWLLSSVCFASLVSITSAIYFAPEESWKMWPAALACFLTNLSSLYLAEYFSVSIRHNMERQNLKLQKEYYEDLERNQAQIRKFRHDMQNQLAVIKTLFDEGEEEEAKTCLKELETQTAITNRVFCKNSVINAVLNAKYNLALEHHIDCFFHIDLKNILAMDSISLCSLFSNTLDNAIEASLKIPDPEQRKISVKARVTENGYFSYEVKNNKVNPVRRQKGAFLSDKETADPHGLGLSNVREVVEKYEGTLDISYTEDTFCVTILIANVC